MMFKGGTFLCKVKAILLPVKLKASPGRQGEKGIPRNLKKVKSITLILAQSKPVGVTPGVVVVVFKC